MNAKMVTVKVKTTELTADERQRVMQTMRDNLNKQDDPKVGIFLYHPVTKQLFGVRSAHADELSFNSQGKKTIKDLHKSVWQKERFKKNPQFSGKDYTLLPRGRIFEYVGDGFKLLVGDWYKAMTAQDRRRVLNLIKREFDLPGLTTKDIVMDEHWNIGQGWDG